MKRNTIQYWVGILLLAATACLWLMPAHAARDYINQDIMLERNGDLSMIHLGRELDLQRKRADKTAQGSELTRAVRAFVRRTRDFLAVLKRQQSDQMRGAALNSITTDNARDTLRRNRDTEQVQKRIQKDRIQRLKDRNRELKQRIQDLSR